MKILIAGANRGLGFVLAKMMAAEDGGQGGLGGRGGQGGHTVFAGCRAPFSEGVKREGAINPRFFPIELDVTNDASVEAAAAAVRPRGPLDAVIVAAGVLPPSDRPRQTLLQNSPIEELRAALETNATGSLRMIHRFHGLVRDGGFFILVTSEAGSVTNNSEIYPLYSVSKAAQNKLAAVFARSEPRLKILAIHPGRMNTDMGRWGSEIEPETAAAGFRDILTGSTPLPPGHWFIDYRGNKMEV